MLKIYKIHEKIQSKYLIPKKARISKQQKQIIWIIVSYFNKSFLIFKYLKLELHIKNNILRRYPIKF